MVHVLYPITLAAAVKKPTVTSGRQKVARFGRKLIFKKGLVGNARHVINPLLDRPQFGNCTLIEWIRPKELEQGLKERLLNRVRVVDHVMKGLWLRGKGCGTRETRVVAHVMQWLCSTTEKLTQWLI